MTIKMTICTASFIINIKVLTLVVITAIGIHVVSPQLKDNSELFYFLQDPDFSFRFVLINQS